MTEVKKMQDTNNTTVVDVDVCTRVFTFRYIFFAEKIPMHKVSIITTQKDEGGDSDMQYTPYAIKKVMVSREMGIQSNKSWNT